MATSTPFPQAGWLIRLQAISDGASAASDAALGPVLTEFLWPPQAQGHIGTLVGPLLTLLLARQAVLQAALETAQVADDLRRYQKFAKAGQPSPHIVQLRQQQGAVRQASSRARQLFIAAAAGFVREARIAVPPRVALEPFVIRWIEINLPADTAAG